MAVIAIPVVALVVSGHSIDENQAIPVPPELKKHRQSTTFVIEPPDVVTVYNGVLSLVKPVVFAVIIPV